VGRSARPSRSGPRRLGGPLPLLPLALIAGYGCLTLAWALANPPFASPDEGAHYVRALGVGGGELVGRPTSFSETPTRKGLVLAWLNSFAREIQAPARLAPYSCAWSDVLRPACDPPPRREGGTVPLKTYTGTYEPAGYLVPGILARRAHEAAAADRLARVGAGAVSTIFVAVAILVLWAGDVGGLSLLGLPLGVTPMVIFLDGTVNPNALEIASGLAFVAALLRLSRGPPISAWPWSAAGAAGAMLCLSRGSGILWLVLALLLILAFGGRRPIWAAMRGSPALPALACGTILVAVVFNQWWQARYGPRPTLSLHPFHAAILTGTDQLNRIFKELVGAFDHLEIKMPFIGYATWWAGLFALLALAALVGTRRERRTLTTSVAAAFVVPVAFWVVYFRFSGAELQGRYFLPILVAIPLLAGEIVYRNRTRLAALHVQWLLLWLVLGTAFVQFLAWYWNARRFAVGQGGPKWFVTNAVWSPPGGWWLWLFVAGAGSLSLVAGGVIAGRSGRSSSSSHRSSPPK
jgi:hypothetical protein